MSIIKFNRQTNTVLLIALVLFVLFLSACNDKVPLESYAPTPSEVESTVDNLPEPIAAQITEAEIEEAIAKRNVLLEEADNQEIIISDDDANAYIDNIKIFKDISDEEFNAQLKQQGMTEEEAIQQVKDMMAISQLLEQEIDLELKVSEEEIDAYIEKNMADIYEIVLEYDTENIEIFREKARQQVYVTKQKIIIDNYIDSLGVSG